MEAGLDSLTAIELRNAIERRFAVQLPATIIFDYPSIDALTGFVVSLAAPKPANTSAQSGTLIHNIFQRPILYTV